MSCEDCEKFQEETDKSYYFRWKNANIELRGCEKHIKEIIDILKCEQNLKLIEEHLNEKRSTRKS
jgi:hypothetical protein